MGSTLRVELFKDFIVVLFVGLAGPDYKRRGVFVRLRVGDVIEGIYRAPCQLVLLIPKEGEDLPRSDTAS